MYNGSAAGTLRDRGHARFSHSPNRKCPQARDRPKGIAVAYAAAMARDLLGSMPVRMEVNVSGNILKNVKSVVVPNTGGLRGIQAAAAAGAAVGQANY